MSQLLFFVTHPLDRSVLNRYLTQPLELRRLALLFLRQLPLWFHLRCRLRLQNKSCITGHTVLVSLR